MMKRTKYGIDPGDAPDGYAAVASDSHRCDGCDLLGTDSCEHGNCLPETRRDGSAVVFKRKRR